MTVGRVGILLGTFLTSVASLSKFDPFEQNEHLKAQLDNLNGEIKRLKEEEESFMDQVNAASEKRSASVDTLKDDSVGLQEVLEKLKAEYKEKEHCLKDWLDAHSKMKESVMAGLHGESFVEMNSSAQPVWLRSPPYLMGRSVPSTAVRFPLRSARRSPTRLRPVHIANGKMQEEAFDRVDVPEAEASRMDDTNEDMAVADSEVMKQTDVITPPHKPVHLRGPLRKMNINGGSAFPNLEGASVVHVGAEDFSSLSAPHSMALGDRIVQDPSRDKMEVIKENKALERAVAVAKSDAQRLFIANQKHNATLQAAATRSKHWNKLTGSVKGTYQVQEDNLKLQIANLDKKCKEVEGIKGVPQKIQENFDAITTTTTTTIMVSSIATCKKYSTNLNDQGSRRGKKGMTIYFDRHNVQCKAGAAMTGWKLSRGGTNDKIKFEYNCCEFRSNLFGQCSNEATPLNDDGGKNRPSVYLDRHNVACKSGTAMSGWRLDRAGTNDKIQIKYKCCKVNPNMGQCTTKSTPPNDWGKGQTIYLDRHNAQCDADQVMTRWKLKRPKGDQINIEYTCCKALKIPQWPGGAFQDPFALKAALIPVPPLQPLIGHMVAIYCPKHGRYVRMNGDGDMDVSPPRGYGSIPDDWDAERFLVVDAGQGEVAFHSPSRNRFIRLRDNADMDASDVKAPNQLPGDWTWERFRAVGTNDGQVALHSGRHNRFMRMRDNNRMDGSDPRAADDLPDGWTWERFKVLDLGLKGEPLQPLIGHMVAIYCPEHGRYVRMNRDGDMDVSPPRGYGSIPNDWDWERFLVVDAGQGEVAFHSPTHNRFIRLRDNADMDASDVKAPNQLPADWTWERFTAVGANDGQVAFHSGRHNRFMRMRNNNRMDGSDPRFSHELPDGWTWERFKVLDLGKP